MFLGELTEEEETELGIITGKDKDHFGSPALKGIWFINPYMAQAKNVPLGPQPAKRASRNKSSSAAPHKQLVIGKLTLQELEQIVTKDHFGEEDYVNLYGAMKQAIECDPRAVRPATIEILQHGFNRSGFGSLYYGVIPLMEIAVNVTDVGMGLTCLNILRDILSSQRKKTETAMYSAAADQIAGIAIRRPLDLGMPCMDIFEKLLNTDGLNDSAYEGVSNDIRAISKNTPKLIRKTTLRSLEQIISKDGLEETVFKSAADAIRFIVYNRPELIDSTTIQVLENNYIREGLSGDCYKSIANIIMAISKYRSDLVQEGSLVSLVTLLPDIVRRHSLVHYKAYYNRYFIDKTKDLNDEERYSISLAAFHLLRRMNLNVDDEKAVAESVKMIVKARDGVSNRIVVGNNTVVINILNSEERFSKKAIEKLEREAGAQSILTFKGTADMDDAFEAIAKSDKKSPLTILYNGHGIECGLLNVGDFGLGGIVSSRRFVDALNKRGEDLSNVTIIVDSCYSYHFCCGLLSYLAAGITDKMPVVISSSNFGRISYNNLCISSIVKVHAPGSPLYMEDIFKAAADAFEEQDTSIFIPLASCSEIGLPKYLKLLERVPGYNENADINRPPSNVVEVGFEGGLSHVDETAFLKAMEEGALIDIDTKYPEYAPVLSDKAMGGDFSTPEIYLVSREVMVTVAPGHNVVRLQKTNKVLIVDDYWNNDLKDTPRVRLDILMHEAMSEWMERVVPDEPAGDIAVDIEGEKADERARRDRHKASKINELLTAKNEAKRIHDENRDNYTPVIPGKTILCHIIADSILPEGQRDMLRILEQEMRGEEYSEKIVCIPANAPGNFIDELKAVMARQRELYKDCAVEFDVACPDRGLVQRVLESDLKGVGALAFEPCEEGGVGYLIGQVEGIMLALRALHSGNIESLQRVFEFLTGTKLPSAALSMTDINEFVKAITFVLPVSRVKNYNEFKDTNDLISKNIKSAA
ncbi:MAG: hypothetical protein PHP46_04315 [Candidatus Omnitrophica bacterium]|nr:hypothetical protein [Candidatus Omnitrophota bacterium]